MVVRVTRVSGPFLLAAAISSACATKGEDGPPGDADPQCDSSLVHDGDVRVQSQVDLEVLRGHAALIGNLSIVDPTYPYDTVTDIGALGCLASVDGSVTIIAPYLPSLAALENLTTVTGSFALEPYESVEIPAPEFNTRLRSLDGLEGLEDIGGDLTIRGQSALENLDALSNLQRLGGSLSITKNEALPTCEAEQLRDHVGTANIGGDVEITGNDDAGVCTTP